MKNFITNTNYKGKNLDRLNGKSKHNEFCTFLQGKANGLKLKKGSKGIYLVAFKKVKNKKTKKDEDKPKLIKNGFVVFSKENWENIS